MEFLMGERSRLVGAVLPLLLWFAGCTAAVNIIARVRPDRKRALYTLSAAIDVAFATLLIRATGLSLSNFYLAYYPVIALAVFYFGAAGGGGVTLLSAAAYASVYMSNPDQLFIGDFALRIGFMALVYFVLAGLVESEKRSRTDIEKQKSQITELNRRYEAANQELIDEREAQTDIIAEKNRLLNGKNVSDARRRAQSDFARELNAQNDASKTAALFSRYLRALLDADRADIILLRPQPAKALFYPSGDDEEIQELPLDHPIIRRALADADDEGWAELTWRPGGGEEIPQELLLQPDIPAAALHIQTLTGRRMGITGMVAVSSRAGCNFDPELLDEMKILASHFTVAIENIALRAKLQEMADTDGLTGVYNHRFFQNRLDSEIERAERYDQPLSLILFDIDHFKKLNDTMGHQTGDSVLRELAIIVKNQLRNVDTLCRYGGEEFAAILIETDSSGAAGVAERIRCAVAKHTFQDTAGKAFGITVSLGIGAMPPLKEKKEIIKAADDALYRAKESGRNCVAS
jgi:diguanylate cyclase (GGDEF)-like protein